MVSRDWADRTPYSWLTALQNRSEGLAVHCRLHVVINRLLGPEERPEPRLWELNAAILEITAKEKKLPSGLSIDRRAFCRNDTSPLAFWFCLQEWVLRPRTVDQLIFCQVSGSPDGITQTCDPVPDSV